MSEFYKATSTKNPARNGTEEVILARDEKTGEVTKSIKVNGAPVELTEEEHDSAGKYLNLRKVSDVEEERKKYEASLPVQQPGEDVAGAGPLFAPPSSPVARASQQEVTEPVKTEGKAR